MVLEKYCEKSSNEMSDDNIKTNLPLIESTGQSISALIKKYNGHEHICLIGAGPSYDDTRDEINERYADGCLIIASDRMSSVLDFNPHIVCTIDPTHFTTDFISPLRVENTEAIISAKSNPLNVPKIKPENRYWFFPPDTENKSYNKEQSMRLNIPQYYEFGHNIGTAFFIAHLMNPDKIELFGCDYYFYGHEFYDHIQKDTFFILTKYHCNFWNEPAIKRKSHNIDRTYMFMDGAKITAGSYPTLKQHFSLNSIDEEQLEVKKYTDITTEYNEMQLTYVIKCINSFKKSL